MFLTEAEVRTLAGKHRWPACARALARMGIEHRMRPDGSLAVSIAHVETVLSGGSVRPVKKGIEPDFAAISC